MNGDAIKIGDKLWPVPRSLAAPGICYRTVPPRVTVVAFRAGDVVDVVEPDGTPHRIGLTDLSRIRPAHLREPGRSRTARKQPTPEPDPPRWTEDTLW